MAQTRVSIGWLSIVFVPVGIGLILLAGWMVSRDPAFSGAAMSAAGRVVDLKRSQSGNGVASYRPVVVFRDASGVERQFVGGIGANPPDYRKGDQVAVRYDPAAPVEAVIDSWSQRLMGPGVAFGLGGLLLWFEARSIRSALRARRLARVRAKDGINLPPG
jgi:hypothetical protein